MNYRDKFKRENPMFERINMITPMDVHHIKQKCDGGSDDIRNLTAKLSGRHDNYPHHQKGKNMELGYEDYLFLE